jgi:hypothetical protein
MGTGNNCDAAWLSPGNSCIIEVDSVNSPTGFWWGEVIEISHKMDYLHVKAKIVGGRVKFNDGCEEIKSSEQRGVIPNLNYHVYSDTETTRSFVRHIIRETEKLRGKLRDMTCLAENNEKLHITTMKALIEQRVIDSEDE